MAANRNTRRPRGSLLFPTFRCAALACLMLQSMHALAESGGEGTPALRAGSPDSERRATNPRAATREVRISNSPTVVRLWREAGGGEQYAAAMDGRTFSRALPVSNVVRLRYANFDPLAGGNGGGNGEPPVDHALSSPLANDLEGGGEGIYIVQFIAGPLEPMLSNLRALAGGQEATPLVYLPDECFIVRMTPAAREAAALLPEVRWIGGYHPAYRLDEQTLAALSLNLQGGPDLQPQRYSIELFERGAGPQQIVAQRIAALGGTVTYSAPQGFRLEATLDGAQLLEVIRMNEVQFVDPRGEPGVDMDIARQIGGAVPLLSGAGFTGQGVRGEVLDQGFRTTHQAFQSPAALLHGGNGTITSHGTCTYGIVFGNGAANAAGTGMLPDREQGFMASYTVLTNRYTHTAQLVDPAGPYRAVFQSNSWGDALTTQYTTISADMDDIIFLNDILICQSQSNAGTQQSRPQAWAKNIVSVGGVTHQNTLARPDDRWTAASIGPASDGRIKPDLAHFYDNILCPSSTSDTSYTTTFGGTSGATPITAGHFGLLFQMWHQQAFPGFGGASSVFDSRPHAATAKALMINTAYRYDWIGGGVNNATLTRVKQGWGMPDVGRLYTERNNLFIVNETDVLTPLTSHVYHITVPAGQPDFRATMVYRDPRGNPASSIHRINDLSMQVTAPGGTVYWGNNGLIAGNVSTSGGVSNTVDTVENVFLTAPTPGVWTVTVSADVLVQDSNTLTPALDAAYALVVTGQPPALVGDVNGDGHVDVDDLLAVITSWGPCPAPPATCPADIAPTGGDGQVNVDDLLVVITHWS